MTTGTITIVGKQHPNWTIRMRMMSMGRMMDE
eukprot:CAMPEP_0170785734 /NCGR_PEP_ID=MMETSP0733-20121128/17128_1 /TAXON_ID=186038 /ORGANISM="Fragilariopsis kerguelensis, Strain L26-C5" /LENGTH=31 /DNA_ID= /DNA_START= /DNA_END= /DNA_ORIENTATION=